MQIMRISSNSNNQNKPSFNGKTEQEIFKKVLSVPRLKKLLEQSAESNNNQPFINFITDAFEKLQNNFGIHHKITTFIKRKGERGVKEFVFKLSSNEKIHIRINTETLSIFYEEITPPIPKVTKSKFISYHLPLTQATSEINRVKGVAIYPKPEKKNGPINAQVIEALEILEPKQPKFKPLHIQAGEMEGVIKDCPIKRNKQY